MELTAAARQALSLMDLTTLNDDDTDAKVVALCHDAVTPVGNTAAICIYPRFISIARNTLNELGVAGQVKIATVTNFPAGGDDIDSAVAQTRAAVAAGADEVDLVFPYRALMAGNEQVGLAMVKACKAVCGDVLLKVIIESGELGSAALIRQASDIAIAAGADFIKTSTGKVAVNATLEAAEIMLGAIKDSGKNVGFKAAGGVRSAADAAAYLTLAENIMGNGWLSAAHFRFGASSLLGSLLNTLGVQVEEQQGGY